MNKIFTIFALAVLFFFCGSIWLKVVVKEVLFLNEEKVLDTHFIAAVKESLPIKTKEKIFYTENYENNYKFNFYQRIRWRMENYSTIQYHRFGKVIAKIINDFEILFDYYTFSEFQFKKQSINIYVQKIAYFKHVLDSIGIPLVCAQYPSRIFDDDELANIHRAYETKAKLELMEKLLRIGVPVIDLTKESRHSMFYKTDHHWQVKTSIWAGQVISKELNNLYGFDLNVELLDTNNFTEKLVGSFLGVMYSNEKENFYTYSPRYATDINWTLFHNNEVFQSSGSFESLYHFHSDSTCSIFSAYVTAYPYLILSQNNNLPNGKKILIIGDSFNFPLDKFLSLIFKEVRYINRRSGFLDDYLANKPDVVLLGFTNTNLYEDPKTLIF